MTRLSSPSPPSPARAPTPDILEHFNDQIRDLANSDEEVHKELIENTITTEFKDEDQNDDDNDLWWDSSSPPPQFYISTSV